MAKGLIALAAAACTLLAGGAAEANCLGGTFAGAYIGGGVGMVRHRGEQFNVDEGKIRDTDTSFAASGVIGYSMQCGNVVLGIDADISSADSKTEATWDAPTGPIHTSSGLDWFGTVRGHVGYVLMPNLMGFVTGGLAYGDITHTLHDPGFAFTQKDSGNHLGWTIGFGSEYVLHSNWRLRSETLYVDLGDKSHTYNITACGVACTATAKWDDSFWVSRLSLVYRFGEERPAYTPLK